MHEATYNDTGDLAGRARGVDAFARAGRYRWLVATAAIALVAAVWWLEPAEGGASGAAILFGMLLTAWALWDLRERGWNAPHPLWAATWLGLFVFSLFVYPLIGAFGVVAGYAGSRKPPRLLRWALAPSRRRKTWVLVSVAVVVLVAVQGNLSGTPAGDALFVPAGVAFAACVIAFLGAIASSWWGQGATSLKAYAAAATFGAILGLTLVMTPLLRSEGVSAIGLAFGDAQAPLVRGEILTLLLLPAVLIVWYLRGALRALWGAGERRIVADVVQLSVLALLGVVAGLDGSIQPNAAAEFAAGAQGAQYVGALLGMIALVIALLRRRVRSMAAPRLRSGPE